MMQETPKTLLEETSELLDALIPVLERSIDALQHDPSPLLQHLISQEIESQESLLQRIEEIKGRLHDCLNPPKEVAQPTQSHHADLHANLHPDEKTYGPSAIGALPVGAAIRKPFPLTVTIPKKDLVISRYYAIDTLIEVIKVLGIEEVRDLGIMLGPIPLVAIKDYEDCQQKEVEGYYIAQKSTTWIKAVQIELMGDMLEIQLNVEQNNIV